MRNRPPLPRRGPRNPADPRDRRTGWDRLPLLFLLIPLALGAGGCSRPTPPPVLATVGNRTIDAHAFEERWENLLRLGGENLQPSETSLPRLKEKLLGTMVSEELLLLEAEKRGVQVGDEELEKKVTELKGEVPATEFQRHLLEQYIDERQWRESLKRSLTIEKLVEMEAQAMGEPTEPELLKMYEEHREEWILPARIHLYQILVERREEAERIKQELKQGKNFFELARRYSRGSEKERGGDLGWVRFEDLPKELQSAFDLPLRRFSEIIASPYGYHILYVTERAPQRTMSFKEALPILHRRALQKRRETARYLLLERARASTPITIHAELWNQLRTAP